MLVDDIQKTSKFWILEHLRRQYAICSQLYETTIFTYGERFENAVAMTVDRSPPINVASERDDVMVCNAGGIP